MPYVEETNKAGKTKTQLFDSHRLNKFQINKNFNI